MNAAADVCGILIVPDVIVLTYVQIYIWQI